MTGFTRWDGTERSWQPFEPTAAMIEEYAARRAERDREFLSRGLDRNALTVFLIDSVEPVASPVLDIGTGRGLGAVELAKRGHRVVSIDLDEEIVKVAITNAVIEKVADDIDFHVADANSIPFEGSKFPLVVMIDVLHHLDDSSGLLPEVSRVLAPGGKFMFCDFTRKGFEILDEIHGGNGHAHSHEAGETVKSLADSLSSHGLRCVGRDLRFHQEMVIAEKL